MTERLANVGLNVLFRNNGDATFSDVTRDSGLNGSVWTTSCLVADLNGAVAVAVHPGGIL